VHILLRFLVYLIIDITATEQTLSRNKLAKYLYLLLKHGVTIAVVTAAGYEYQTMKYELRLSGLLTYFKEKGLEVDDLERFYIFGGECNYLLRVSELA
jgi:IMP and pyridine-specific 5'-nucleotidase